MSSDEEIVLNWMMKMAVKEKSYPDLVNFWIDAINEKLMEIVKRESEGEISNSQGYLLGKEN